MSDYSPTQLFTLVPEGFSDNKTRDNIFCTLFPEEKGAEVFSVPVPQYSAVLIYGWEGRNASITPEAGVLPTVYKHLKDLAALSDSPEGIGVRVGTSLDPHTFNVTADGIIRVF